MSKRSIEDVLADFLLLDTGVVKHRHMKPDERTELLDTLAAADLPLVDRERGIAVYSLADIERLLAWKRDAILVLNEWERVWEALGKPGPLGGSKAANSLARIIGGES